MVVDDFLTREEAEMILDRYGYLLRDSMQMKETAATKSKYRTSRSVRLPPLGDRLVFDIEKRAASLAGFNHSYCEDFQLACYDVDQLYGLHRDDTDDKHSRPADRSATILVYLKQPQSGGETLFTRRPLEDERDPDTKKPLKTEVGALKLFRSYCDKPKKKFIIVSPDVGKAVTWRNWYGDGLKIFAKSSTHGACPVTSGQKCVIQQWVSKSAKLPLRDERVAAIFPAGADLHYSASTTTLHSPPRCLADSSVNMGDLVSELCLINDDAKLNQLDELQGPFKGVGALRISGGLGADLPAALVDNGFTISFWAQDIAVGSAVVSIRNLFSVVFREQSGNKQIFDLTYGSVTSELTIYNGSSNQWSWFSVALEKGKSLMTTVYSKGKQVGSASLDLDTCEEVNGLTSYELRILSLPRRDQWSDEDTPSSDVSFIMIHESILDDPQEVAMLGEQVKRYDINK